MEIGLKPYEEEWQKQDGPRYAVSDQCFERFRHVTPGAKDMHLALMGFVPEASAEAPAGLGETV